MLLLFLGTAAWSSDLLVHRLTVADGLPDHNTTSIAQADDGALWIGFDGAVARYDGVEFELYPTEPWTVYSARKIVFDGSRTLVLDSYGKMWASSGQALKPLHGPSARMRDLFEGPNGRIIAVSPDALYALNGDDWDHIVAGPEGAKLLVGTTLRDQVWVGSDLGWFGLDDGSWQSGPAFERPHAAVADGAGGTWWLQNAPVRVYHQVPGEEPRLELQVDVLRAQPPAVVDDTLWFGAEGSLHALRRDGSAESWAAGNGPGIKGGFYLDREGALWSTSFGGLAQLPEPRIRHWHAGKGLPGTTARRTVALGDTIFVSTWAGLARMSQDGEVSAVERGHSGALCLGPDGTIWAHQSEDGGWYSLREDGQAHRFVADLGVSWSSGCLADRDGVLLIAGNQLQRVVGSTVEPFAPALPWAADAFGERHLTRSNGVLWAARMSDICRLEGEGWSCRSLHTRLGVSEILPRPDGSVWVSTRDAGIFAFDAAGRPPEAITTPMDVRGLTSASDGSVWVFGDRVRKLSYSDAGTSWLEPIPLWLNPSLGSVEGLRETDTHLWLASNVGLIAMPKDIASQALPPRAPSKVYVDGVSQDWRELTLPSPDSVLRVPLVPATLRAPSLTRHRYRFDGEPWSEPLSSSELVLRGLQPGQRTLSIQTSPDGENWDDPAHELVLSVPRPMTQQPAFWALIAALGGALGAAWMAVRRASERRLARLRTRVAMDLHDELGAGMASIGLLAGLIADGVPEDSSRELASRIADDAADLGQDLSAIVWSLRPGHTQLGALFSYVAHRAEALLPAHKVEVHLPESLRPVELPVDRLRALQLVMVEALHNVAKHANASSVRLVGFRDGRSLEICVADDGVWTEKGSNGLGLQSMSTRLRDVGGELTIERGLAGTTVRARLPLSRRVAKENA